MIERRPIFSLPLRWNEAIARPGWTCTSNPAAGCRGWSRRRFGRIEEAVESRRHRGLAGDPRLRERPIGEEHRRVVREESVEPRCIERVERVEEAGRRLPRPRPRLPTLSVAAWW
jgi:hypothetical protein